VTACYLCSALQEQREVFAPKSERARERERKRASESERDPYLLRDLCNEYRVTSLIQKRAPLGPYRRTMHRAETDSRFRSRTRSGGDVFAVTACYLCSALQE